MAVAAAVAAVLTVAWRFLGFVGFNNDHYVHVSRAYQMLLGEWPVRDFVDPGMPLMYAVSAAARALFGPALGTEWGVVAGAYAIAAACTVVAGSRLSGSVAVALLVTAFEVMLNPRPFGYPKIVLYALAAVLILRAAAAPTRRRIVALALLTAAAFLFRHDHGLYIGVASVVAIAIGSAREGWRVAAQRAAELAAWTAAVLSPWAVFVQVHMGLVRYFVSGIAFSREEAKITALRGLPPIDLAHLDTTGNALSFLFYLFHALPFVCLAVLAVRILRNTPQRWPGETAAIAALAVLGLVVNAGFLRNSLEGRIADAFVPAGLLGAWMIGLALSSRRRFITLSASAALVVVTSAAVVRAADVREQLGRTGVLSRAEAVQQRAADLWTRLGKRLPERDHVPSRYSRAMLPFLEYVERCTDRNDRLLMTGLFPEVYVLADRGFAGGHMAYMTGFYVSEEDQAAVIARLRRQSVPFVIVVSAWQSEFRQQMPQLVAFLDPRYQPMTHIPVPETQGVDIYVERGRTPARTDAATGWPCFTR